VSRTTRDLMSLSFSIDADRLFHAFKFTTDPRNVVSDQYGDKLKRVLVEPHPNGGVYIVGCDGGIAVVQFDPAGFTSTPFCIGLTDNERAMLKGDFVRRRTLALEEEGEQMTLKTVGQRSTEFRATDFKHGDEYPRWRSLLPKWSDLRPGVPGKLNASYLGRLCSMVNPELAPQRRFDMYCAECGSSKIPAAVVFFPHNPNMLAIVAPMQNVDNDAMPTEPVWLNPAFDPADDL
jgi:hypothetical protein